MLILVLLSKGKLCFYYHIASNKHALCITVSKLALFYNFHYSYSTLTTSYSTLSYGSLERKQSTSLYSLTKHRETDQLG